jgi:hypothetical protein
MRIAYIPESYSVQASRSRHNALEQVRPSKMESARRQAMPHAPALLNTQEIGGGVVQVQASATHHQHDQAKEAMRGMPPWLADMTRTGW